jgi:prophage antirepressor-like protein
MGDSENNPEARVALFQSREIRRALHNGEWWFVITDTIDALTYAANPADY